MFYNGGMVAAELAELGVVPASALSPDVTGRGIERRLPVLESLRGVLPDGIGRGMTVSVTGRGVGTTSLMLGLLAAASEAGAWCVVIGTRGLSLAGAAGLGAILDRFAVVPDAGPDVSAVVATMPVPSRRAEGKFKTRLVLDPARAPVIAQIFTWRAGDRLSYQAIADRLNSDPEHCPPPVSPVIGPEIRHLYGHSLDL
jgi:hypothetical protein